MKTVKNGNKLPPKHIFPLISQTTQPNVTKIGELVRNQLSHVWGYYWKVRLDKNR